MQAQIYASGGRRVRKPSAAEVLHFGLGGSKGLYVSNQGTSGIPSLPTVSTAPSLNLDANAGVAVTGGTTVTTWTDQSANAFVVTFTGGGRPTLTALAQNSLPGITFDGVANYGASAATLTNLTGSATTTQPYTIFTCFKTVGAGAQNGTAYLNQGIIASINDYAGVFVSSTNVINETFDTAARSSQVANTNSTPTYSTQYYDGTNLFSQLKQAGAVTGNATTGPQVKNTETIVVGRNAGTGTAYYPGDLYQILWYPANLSAPDKLTIQQYLAAKWAL